MTRPAQPSKPSSTASTSDGSVRQVVAALEDRGHAWGELQRTRRELTEAVRREREVGERVVDVRIEAARDEQQVGRETADGVLDDPPRLEVIRVGSSRGERDVDHRLALVGGSTGARVERPLVQRDEQDRRVVLDDVLSPVPVVHVPVDDRNALDPEVLLRPTCGDRDRVEQAEAHRTIALGVVTWRPRQGEAASSRRLDRRACGEQRGLERRPRADRVAVDQAFGRAHLLDELRCVAAEHVLDGGRRALDEREVLLQHGQSLL